MEGVFTKFKIFVVVLLLGAISIFAQTGSGKLAGKITDAQTGEPLIGANIIIENTNLGAASDLDGNYFILNITPGTYTVKISFVGYSQKTVQEVRIVAGITYELNETLTSGIDLDEIVVTDKKLFEEKSTNTVKVVDAEQIARLPVRGVENIASLQAGVVVSEGSGGLAGNATLNVRGGRGNEVLYIVDGVVQNDLMWGQNFAQVSNNAVDQLSFQVGGYEAKYGQAQSGIINVTTKSGSMNYKAFGEAVTSHFTDDYGYNLYSVGLSGPIIPGVEDHTIFLSAERGWYLDANPSAIPIEFPSIGTSSNVKPNNSSGVWRFSGKTSHELGKNININLSTNINTRDSRIFDYTYAKNNSEHNARMIRDNYSYSMRFSHNLGSNSFYNVTFGVKRYFQEEGDGVFFDNLEAYGDTLQNPYIPFQSDQAALAKDQTGIFRAHGFVDNYYRKIDNITYSGDFNFTSQFKNHLLEFGGGLSYSILRYYSIAPVGLAQNSLPYVTARGDTIPALSLEARYERARPTRYGYDVMGNELGSNDSLGANTPLLGNIYLQDRFELEDLVLNLGLRMDFIDSRAKILKDPSLPFAGGSDPNGFDDGDFVEKDPEFYFSPRIGIGFPVTESTVFHAQYGKFIQTPRLIDLYPLQRRLDYMVTSSNFTVNDGYVESEITTQYEVGFRQILGNGAAALNITAFYKNTQGLSNVEVVNYRRTPDGEVLQYYPVSNSDFGTIKGVAISLNVPRLSYFSFSLDYTYQTAEGTGSSSNANYIAAFRNPTGEVPKVIAPLNFDQRHTGTAVIDFYIPAGELGFMEKTGVNFLISFASGRPYTPLASQNLMEDFSNWGNTTGYVNSTYGPGTFRIDMRLEKSFTIGNSFEITPYLWIENLLDADNVVQVWRSSGSAYTTNWLDTERGKKDIQANGAEWAQDYMSLERNPNNFGIPRMIRLGVKMNLSGI